MIQLERRCIMKKFPNCETCARKDSCDSCWAKVVSETPPKYDTKK